MQYPDFSSFLAFACPHQRILSRHSQDNDQLDMTAGRIHHATCGSLLTCRFLGWSLSLGTLLNLLCFSSTGTGVHSQDS
eukprot:3320215-Pleurochrysis_carterae.AAC.1